VLLLALNSITAHTKGTYYHLHHRASPPGHITALISLPSAAATTITSPSSRRLAVSGIACCFGSNHQQAAAVRHRWTDGWVGFGGWPSNPFFRLLFLHAFCCRRMSAVLGGKTHHSLAQFTPSQLRLRLRVPIHPSSTSSAYLGT
jgi:hypothetical protein